MTGATNLSHFLKNIAPLWVKNNVACFAAHLSNLIVMQQFSCQIRLMADSEEEPFILHNGYCNPDITKIFVLQAAHMDGKVSKINLQYCIKSCTNLLPISFPAALVWFHLMWGNPRQSWILYIDSRYWILNVLSAKRGFWIPINSGILDSLSCILNYKAQDPGFHSKNLLDSRNKKQKFPSFWNQNSLTRHNRLEDVTFRV